MSSWDVYDDMNLYMTREQFIIEPYGKDKLLCIDRVSQYAKVVAKANQVRNEVPVRRVCGVLGTIRLVGGQYLIVATHRLFVGIVNGAVIWRLAGYDVIPYIPSTTHLSPSQRIINEMYLNMLRKALDTKYYYFSYWYDLTHTQQRLHSMPPDFLKMGLFERADARFVWNVTLIRNFNCSDMNKFALPLIQGFISVNEVVMNGRTFYWSIISRRSIQRAGPRLYSRGIDEHGHVSNFVETEQLIECNGHRISFVQTRGSMPFYWSQMPNLRYKPDPTLVPGMDHLAACIKHFEAQTQLYGKQVIINLVDQKGPESVLEKAFATFISQMNSPLVRYESFDFHKECRKMKYERLNILIDRLAHEQDEFSLFHLRDDSVLVSSQEGVFRTNCIDCLDRTNVVQSMLARRFLNRILQKLEILLPGQRIETSSSHFEMLFKSVWADNADMISLQYSGTCALKTDFTRTGKRTHIGLLNDGINSITRYYLNNFCDGFRQDAIDVMLGKYTVTEGEGVVIPSPLTKSRGWKYGTFPPILLFAISMLFISIIFPTELQTENLLFLLFWASMVGITAVGIFRYGHEFVDTPRLYQPVKVEA